jgi:pullulanase/glycogen debranching enzyme
MGCMGHLANVRERRGAYRGLMGNVVEIDHLKDLGVPGSIILRWVLK